MSLLRRLTFWSLAGWAACWFGNGSGQAQAPPSDAAPAAVASEAAPGLAADAEPRGAEAEHLLYRASLVAAEASLRLHETDAARYWLEQAPAPWRHWEWAYLRAQTDQAVRSEPIAAAHVTALDISPDGRRLAVADAAGNIEIRELPSWQVLRTIRHPEAVYSLQFASDSVRLASVSRDVTSRVWDTATGAELARMELANPGVAAVAFAPDGQRVATCSWLWQGEGEARSVRGAVWIWSATTGEVLSHQLVGIKPLDSLSWSADGHTLVAGSWDGLVHILDQEGREQRTIALPDEGIYNAVVAVDLSPDGQFVAAGSKDRTARIWRVSDGALHMTMSGHLGYVNEVAFAADGRSLVTASVDGTLRVWETGSGRLRHVLHGHTRSVESLQLSPDGATAVSGGRDGTLRVWHLASASDNTAFRIEPAGTYTATFAPDGERLYLANFNGHVLVANPRSGEVLADWEAHPGSTCNTLSLSADGGLLATCSWDKTARIWNTADQSLRHTLRAEGGVLHCCLAPNGQRVALCVDNQIELWDVASGQREWIAAGHSAGVQQAAFDPQDSNLLVSVSGDGSVRVWDVAAQRCLTTWADHDGGLRSVAVAPDGVWIAAGTNGGRVLLYDRQQGRLVHNVPVGDSALASLAFTPDSARLACGGGQVHLVDPQRGLPTVAIRPQSDVIYHLSFSRDGSRLATCTSGGSIVICETTSASQRFSPAKDQL